MGRRAGFPFATKVRTHEANRHNELAHEKKRLRLLQAARLLCVVSFPVADSSAKSGVYIYMN